MPKTSKAGSHANKLREMLDAAEEGSGILDLLTGDDDDGKDETKAESKDEAEEQVSALIRAYVEHYVPGNHQREAGSDLAELVEVAAGILAPHLETEDD